MSWRSVAKSACSVVLIVSVAMACASAPWRRCWPKKVPRPLDVSIVAVPRANDAVVAVSIGEYRRFTGKLATIESEIYCNHGKSLLEKEPSPVDLPWKNSKDKMILDCKKPWPHEITVSVVVSFDGDPKKSYGRSVPVPLHEEPEQYYDLLDPLPDIRDRAEDLSLTEWLRATMPQPVIAPPYGKLTMSGSAAFYLDYVDYEIDTEDPTENWLPEFMWVWRITTPPEFFAPNLGNAFRRDPLQGTYPVSYDPTDVAYNLPNSVYTPTTPYRLYAIIREKQGNARRSWKLWSDTFTPDANPSEVEEFTLDRKSSFLGTPPGSFVPTN